tara:strand:+ start:3205 stop:3768 length:564 start_codon:yes stop_codon:yes gene_type:complete
MFNPNEIPNLSTGSNAESINNPKGDNAMDTNNQDFTDEEQKIIEELNNVRLTSTSNTTPNSPAGEIPAGSYLSSITNAAMSTHQTGGYDIVRMEIEIQAAPYSGYMMNKVYHLKSKKVRDFLKREAKEIGYEVNDRSELSGFCSDVIGTIVFADVLPSDSGNQTVYLKSANTKKAVMPVDPDALWID